MSLTVGYTIGQMFVPDFEDWSIEEQEAFAERINHPVRKCAHATEYAILGSFLAGTVIGSRHNNNRRIQFLLCLLIGAAYAATDELHQLFVPGRAGKFTDVLIDSGGVIIGLLVACAAGLIWKKWRYHN